MLKMADQGRFDFCADSTMCKKFAIRDLMALKLHMQVLRSY